MTPPSFDHFPPVQGTILVVDDEPSVLAIAAAILNTVDIRPLKARNGEEAIEAVRRELEQGRRVGTAVLDLTMPGGLSGFETLEALRQLDPGIKVIACSGFFQESALELCQSIGFTHILAKPYTPESLLGIIRRVQHDSPPMQAARQEPVVARAPAFTTAPGGLPGREPPPFADEESPE